MKTRMRGNKDELEDCTVSLPEDKRTKEQKENKKRR